MPRYEILRRETFFFVDVIEADDEDAAVDIAMDSDRWSNDKEDWIHAWDGSDIYSITMLPD